MKKILLMAVIAMIFLAGCKNKSAKADEQAVDPATQSEITTLDSLSNKIDSLKTDIDQTAKEVDEMIDKL